uniref:ABC transporter domain-containing protein n=1 Tax=Salix viminalis TaxID=40686 RepID=A0A6N2NG50_SALVM
MSIPGEPPLIIEASRPNRSWPVHGEVEINNLQVLFASFSPMISPIVIVIHDCGVIQVRRDETGIVGRTGSGKSTLIQTLFRIVEPAAGRIMIDGIDISLIGLHDLRSRLSIILRIQPM